MNTVKNITQSLLFTLLVTVVFVITSASIGEAGYNFKELPIPVRLLLSDVRELMNKKEYGRAAERILTFRSGKGKDSAGKPETWHTVVCFTLANCYLLQGNYTQAKKEFTASVKQSPEFLEAWLNLAKTCCELKEYTEAAECYNHAYEQSDPKKPEYLYYCAAGYLMAKQYKPAIAAFEKLFHDHAGDIQQQWRENYIHALLSADQSRRALPVIEAVLENSKGADKTRWQEILLNLYMQLDMHTQAISCATRLARDNPSMAGWWKALVHIYLPIGRYKDALAALTIYGYLTPLTAEEKKLWADLNLQLDIPARATEVYEGILKDNPDNRLMQNLITVYQKLNSNEKALDLWEGYFAQTKDPELLMLKGDLLYTLKRFDEANDIYCRVAKADSGKAGRAWLMAGYAAWKTNNFNAGRRAFENAAKYNPQRKAALLAMTQINKEQ